MAKLRDTEINGSLSVKGKLILENGSDIPEIEALTNKIAELENKINSLIGDTISAKTIKTNELIITDETIETNKTESTVNNNGETSSNISDDIND